MFIAMGPCVFIVLAMIVKSGAQHLPIHSESGDSTMCVCRPHVTVNPPVCARSAPTNGIGCDCSAIEGIVSSELRNTTQQLVDATLEVEDLREIVSGNQESFFSELEDTRRQMAQLKVAVSTNQDMVTTELRNTTQQVKDTRREVAALGVTVAAVVRGIKQQLEELQVSVSGIVVLLNDFLLTEEVRKSDATEGSRFSTTTEADILLTEEVRKSDATEGSRFSTTSEADILFTEEVRQRDATEESRFSTTEADILFTEEVRQRDATEGSGFSTTTEAGTGILPKDCSEILARGVSVSGVYTVQPLDSGEAFQVYCDMETDGGGWTVFQRRMDGSVDFYLDFASYSRGFGNLEGEFWLGNDNLHRLTAQGEYKLRIDLSDFEDEFRYAVYDTFSIADLSDNYRLTIEGFSGNAGDSLSHHNNYQFTTKDRDNDVYGVNCAQSFHGAWWYSSCHGSNLNGAYLRGATSEYARGVVWRQWKEYYYSLKTSEMKIRISP